MARRPRPAAAAGHDRARLSSVTGPRALRNGDLNLNRDFNIVGTKHAISMPMPRLLWGLPHSANPSARNPVWMQLG
jgi:hypothetical protein